jgi:hypothetical protein
MRGISPSNRNGYAGFQTATHFEVTDFLLPWGKNKNETSKLWHWVTMEKRIRTLPPDWPAESCAV